MALKLFAGVLAVGLTLVACGVQANHMPDCSNTYASGTSFSTIKNVCALITDDKLYAHAQLQDELKRLETVETCSCALVKHELAWASLMTFESQVFYESIVRFVEDRAKNDAAINQLIQGPRMVFFSGPEGKRRFLWDGLDYILSSATGDNDDDAIDLDLRKNFSKLYYDQKTLTPKHDHASSEMVAQSKKLRMMVSNVCGKVIKRFGLPFLPYFDRLSRLAENDRLLFTLTAYSDDLYKLRMITRVCLYLSEKGQVMVET